MRLFIGIALSNEVKQQLNLVSRRISESLDNSDLNIRWVAESQLHITLKFLGEVADKLLCQVQTSLCAAVSSYPYYELKIGGVGCFPPRGEPRVIWAGIPRGQEITCELNKSIEKNLSAIGFAQEERAYLPHVTLGRVKKDASRGRLRLAAAEQFFAELSQQVTKVTLFSSQLSSSGAIYSVVYEAPLLSA